MWSMSTCIVAFILPTSNSVQQLLAVVQTMPKCHVFRTRPSDPGFTEKILAQNSR